MSIGHYQSLISQAQAEIESCNNMINNIISLDVNIRNYVKELNCVANNLSEGIYMAGEVEQPGSKVAKKVSEINLFNQNLNANIPTLQARITSLESDIARWEKMIDKLKNE